MSILVFHHGLKVTELISCMGSFALQNGCHLVLQRVVELVDEVVEDVMEGHLAGIPKLLKFFGLVLQASSSILSQICSIIFISGDCAGHP